MRANGCGENVCNIWAVACEKNITDLLRRKMFCQRLSGLFHCNCGLISRKCRTIIETSERKYRTVHCKGWATSNRTNGIADSFHGQMEKKFVICIWTFRLIETGNAVDRIGVALDYANWIRWFNRNGFFSNSRKIHIFLKWFGKWSISQRCAQSRQRG